MSIRRILAFAVSIMLAVAGLGGVLVASNVANAADNNGKIHVHKFQGAPDTSLKNDGTLQTTTGKTPLQGINFDIYKVNGLDLSKNDDVKTASKIGTMKLTAQNITSLKITVDTKDYTLTKVGNSKTTDAQGSADFENLSTNTLYVINEDLASSTPVGVTKANITPSAPFAVALPMTVPDGQNGTKTTNEVHVYPKNAVNTFKKTVQDNNKKIGEDVTYTLTTTPVFTDTNGDGVINSEDVGGYFAFKDTLPANVTYKSVAVTIKGEEATNPADYQVKQEGANNKDVIIEFTKTGIDKIVQKKGEVKAVITATLGESQSGETSNQAEFFPNKYTHDQGEGVKSDKAISKYGDIVVHKKSDAGANLENAEFKIYRATGTTCANMENTELETGKTNAKGLLKFSNLQLSNWKDGQTIGDNQVKPYCVKETKAPAGYQLLPEVHEVKLTKTGKVDIANAEWSTLTNGANAKVKLGENGVEITNYKNSQLPLTGAAGITILTIAGLIALAGGIFISVGRRKNAK